MTNPHCASPQRPSLNHHLLHESKAPDALRHLIVDISRAAKYISYAIQTTEMGLVGETNSSGEHQLKLDVHSDDLIRQLLCESNLVACYASEEQEDVIELSSDGTYDVVFDPLDGSSLVDANFAIGSIFGIYKAGDFVGRSPRDQVAALYVLYGPRTILVYSTGNGVHSFILNDVGEYVLLDAYMGIGDTAKNYSPGNLRAISENNGYKAVLQTWLDEELTLRYSGCMVADIHHIIAKGQGVFTNVGGSSYPDGKLRLLFEVGPFAYLIDQAGGKTSDGSIDILDKKITDIHQRSPIICGSQRDVDRICGILA